MDAPSVETRYATGSGLLIGKGALWVLLADPDDERVVEEIWSLVSQGGTEAAVRVLEAAAAAYPGAVPGIAMVDLDRPSAPLTRGSGRVHLDGATFVLTLDGGTTMPVLAGLRPLLGGIAGASAARVAPLTRDDRVAAEPASLIDGIPAAILAAKGPDGPPPPRPRREVLGLDSFPVAASLAAEAAPGSTYDPDTDLGPAGDTGAWEALDSQAPPTDVPEEDVPAQVEAVVASAVTEDLAPAGVGPLDAPAPETTSQRLARLHAQTDVPGPDPALPPTTVPATASPADAPPTAPPAAGGTEWDDHDGSTVHRPSHLVAQEAPTVYAVACPLGHATSPAQPTCRVCGQRLAPQEPQLVQRPVLGGLRLPTGEVVPLDRGVVIGRRPSPVPGSPDWPHLVHLPSTHAFVSRMHLQIELHGWDVVARDLGSRGGSTLTAPGRPPVPMRAGEAYLLEPGTVLDLADVYAVRFETGVVPQ
ncbi:MAG: FHA domain-containing protein [Nocardioides sp.]|uniref:FHA domain-containing protein n=1 Tax=Nocardioides sp. TaxID=35761 RepID=UPI003F002EDE